MKPTVTFGEIMLRLEPEGYNRFVQADKFGAVYGGGEANVAVSFVCAVQVESFRKLRGRAFATTMCTGNLRSGTEALWRFARTGEREELRSAGRYYGIILCFVLGAALGALAGRVLGERSVLLCCLLLAAAFGMMFPGRGEARRDGAD